MKPVTCGVLLIDPIKNWIFLSHVTKTPNWDIPKGIKEVNETPVDAAVRETREETGIELDSHMLVDLGQHPYSRRKDIHLFMVTIDSQAIDLATCQCTSYFIARDGTSLPEVDQFAWFPIAKIAPLISNSMAVVLRKLRLI